MSSTRGTSRQTSITSSRLPIALSPSPGSTSLRSSPVSRQRLQAVRADTRRMADHGISEGVDAFSLNTLLAELPKAKRTERRA
ncbi:hypothetical protein NliqN6_1346 [Naganishia liquefaciens]|uniref:Uncharacterized protein n=1 Tax=Naganishia liquefaciens TaxID=104408 RepID=A0A8H3TQ59_9TREE|nr:hypothetical protein NliqN6_1346 [Naganishia liquefaciens]